MMKRRRRGMTSIMVISRCLVALAGVTTMPARENAEIQQHVARENAKKNRPDLSVQSINSLALTLHCSYRQVKKDEKVWIGFALYFL
jgi:hypothetical protein